MPAPTRVRLLAGLLAAQLLFGFHYLAAKIVLWEVPAPAWAAIRAVAAAAVMSLVLLHGGVTWKRSWRDLGMIALCALFGVVINQICFIEGLARTSSTHSALINATIPLATLGIAAAMGKERIGALKGFALAVAIVGVLLIVRPWRGVTGSATGLGDLLTAVNAVSYSLFLVLAKQLVGRLEPRLVTAGTMLVAAPLIAAYGWAPLRTVGWAALSWRAVSAGLFIVLGSTVVGYMLNNWALTRLDASSVAMFCYVQPVLVSCLGTVLLGEVWNRSTIVGAALIFVGLGLTLRR